MADKKIGETFYDEDGSFRPLTSSFGNSDGELAYLRNTFMESEREYFIYLLSDETIREFFGEQLKEDSSYLLKVAQSIQQSIEYGEVETPEEREQMKAMSPEERDQFHMRKLSRAEGLMCLLFAAARDKAKLLELYLSISDSKKEEKKSMGLGL